MVTAFIWVIGALLLVIAVIDWKFKAVPSIFLTGIMFATAYIQFNSSIDHIKYAILGLIIAYLLFEADFFRGVADIKVMALISLFITNNLFFYAYIILVLLFGFVWLSVVKFRLKLKITDEIAFLPVFFFVYVAMLWLGGLG